MDEDGFIQVKKKVPRQQSNAATGQAPPGQRRGAQGHNAGGRRGNTQSGRGPKGTPDTRQPGRGRPAQSAGAPPPRSAAQQAVRARRPGQVPVPTVNLVSTQPIKISRNCLPRKDMSNTPPAQRMANGLCFAQSDSTSVLKVHSTPQTPTLLHQSSPQTPTSNTEEQIVSPHRSIGVPASNGGSPAASNRGSPGATTGMCSRASTPSTASAHTTVPRPTPRSWADALSRSGLSQAASTQQRVRRNPPGRSLAPVASKQGPPPAIPSSNRLPESPPASPSCKQGPPPATGHASLRVNTHQALGVQSATPTTTAALSTSSAAAAGETDTEESAGIVQPELASLALLATQEFSKMMEHLCKVEHHIPAKLEVLKGLAEFALRLDEAVESAISLEPLEKIVEVYNRYEGFKGDGSPFSVARRQPQLDGALLCGTMIDLVAEDLTRIVKALVPDNAFLAASKDDSEWKMQTRKGNASLQGMHIVAGQRCTPFAEAFRGITATTYHAVLRTSVTVDPFTMLHVRPLQNARDTVQAGLARRFERDVDDGKQAGSHQTLILELPKVLVIHVARFLYEKELKRTIKVKCPVHHPLTLHMKREWFAENAPVKKGTYRLVSKVVHKGERAENGHYVTMARRCGQWMTCDDAKVFPASEAEVMQPNAYMLFYEICTGKE